MRPRLVPLVSVLLLLVVAASCGDDNKKTASTRKATTTSSTEGTTSTTSGASTSTTVAGGGARPGATTTTARGTAPGGTTSPGGGAGGGPAPAVAGKYRYKQSGKATVGNSSSPVAPEGTLAVDAAKPDGAQVFHRVVDERGSTDTTFAFRSDGVFIKATTQRQGSGFQSVSFTCTFNPPVPAPPWPPTVGATFAGKADCGSFTTEVKGKVDGTRKVTLDGAQVDVFTATVSIVTKGQLESTGTSVQWFAPSLRLTVHSEDHTKGSYGPFGFSSDVTSDLVSAKPA